MRQSSLADLAVLLTTITICYTSYCFAAGKHKAATDLHIISHFISFWGGEQLRKKHRILDS